MERRSEITVIVAAGSLAAAVLAWLSLTGLENRVVAEGRRIRALSAAHEAVAAWKEEGVRGRILLHFDRRIRAGAIENGISDENYVYQAAVMNLVRKIYHVVPDASWSEVRERLSRMPGVSGRGEHFRLTIEGTPIIVVPLSHLPPLEEKTLVNIRGGCWNDDDLRSIASFAAGETPGADIITVSGPDADRILRILGERNERTL